jgi:ComF family protein
MAWWKLPGLATLFDLVCPPRCALCGVDLPAAAEGPLACTACAEAISADAARCGACGEPGRAEACRCRGRCRDWDGIAVLTAYGDDVRGQVLRAKRPAGDAVAAALAGLLVAKHHDTFAAWRIDTVVPVPMHWRRRLTRGTSAADVLAAAVANRLRLPRRRLVRRRRFTPMQNELPFEDRRSNVRGAFVASRRAAGRRILLVDDVTTTGATLAECRRALVEAGASAVYAAVVARADRGRSDPRRD